MDRIPLHKSLFNGKITLLADDMLLLQYSNVAVLHHSHFVLN